MHPGMIQVRESVLPGTCSSGVPGPPSAEANEILPLLHFRDTVDRTQV